MIQTVILFAALFVAGKVASWFVYQVCWVNAVGKDLATSGPVWFLLSRPRLWPVHAVMLALTTSVSWKELSTLQPIAIVTFALLAMGSVFRFGAVDVGNFFFADRLLAVGLCVGVCLSPAFLYPALVVCCCLQYVVSAWKLGPGYSNLLGFEFIRGSACVLVTGIAVYAGWSWLSGPSRQLSALIPMVFLSVQASHYVNHALAKSALGPHWYSWITNNRMECLFVNSYLRGWGARLDSMTVLRLATVMRRLRVPLCGFAWALEFGFVLAPLDARLAAALMVTAAVFHLAVFAMTGLLEIEYVVNHSNLVWLLLAASSALGATPTGNLFGFPLFAASTFMLILSAAWVGNLRTRMLRQYQSSGTSPLARFADPFDHLMAWWDSPYMRMYSYLVITEDGQRQYLPVPKLSPYDTSLTDIHTHMMILGAHPDFDPQAEQDRQHVRSGVWGMVITVPERDDLYRRMDKEDASCLADIASTEPTDAWCCDRGDALPPERGALWKLISGLQYYRDRTWFRLIMKYPHFPGEDLVPDICPLIEGSHIRYRFDRPISSVVVQRVKTFYTGSEILLIECSHVGVIDLGNRTTETMITEPTE